MSSDSFIHACAGGAGGVLAMTATYPLMSISTRAAVMSSKNPNEVCVYQKMEAWALTLLLCLIVNAFRHGQNHARRRSIRSICRAQLITDWCGSVQLVSAQVDKEARFGKDF